MDSTKAQAQPSADLSHIPPQILAFLESMLLDANMTTLDQETHNQMLQELFLRLDNFMLSTIVENLPPDKLEEFTKLSDGGKPREELEDYLRGNIPNSEEVFVQSMLDFRDLYLGNVQMVKDQRSDKNIPTS